MNDRDDEDAAVVLALLLALARSAGPAEREAEPITRWGDPAHRLGVLDRPSAGAWWASGMLR